MSSLSALPPSSDPLRDAPSIGQVLAQALNLQLGQLISIAPAVGRYGFEELSHPGCPWLVVQGDEDELVNIDQVREWVEGLETQPDLVIMERADHFFHRRLMDLRGLRR